jgi:RNA polymerase sigma factor (TIGR02999 family)
VTSQPGSPVTQLLDAAAQGDTAAVNELWSAVYDELHRLARAQLAPEGPDCSHQTTGLVNEAYLRMIGDGHVGWDSRRHFFAAAAKAMRRILVDDARSRGRLKRGGGQTPGPLLDEPPAHEEDPAVMLAIDEALQKLEQADPPRAEIVMLRYFAGLSVDETAAALGVSARTVDTGWRFAKAWLHRELSKGDSTWCGKGGSDDA